MIDEDHVEPLEEDKNLFNVGEIVDVMSRHWPGINKPGGVGRVVHIDFDEENMCFLYDVQYTVAGGKDTVIEERYLRSAAWAESDAGNRRGRSTLGRCKWCQSFIRDCKHDQTLDPNPVLAVPIQKDTNGDKPHLSIQLHPKSKVKGINRIKNGQKSFYQVQRELST